MGKITKINSILIKGRIEPGGTAAVELEPVFSAARSSPNVQDAPCQVVCYGKEGELFRWALSCAWGRADIAPHDQRIPANSPVRFSARIPFHKDLHRLAVVYENVLLQAIKLPKKPPEIDDVTVTREKDHWKLSWHIRKNDKSRTWTMIRHSPDNGETWRRMIPRTKESALELPLSALYGGSDSVLEVIAFDGIVFDSKIVHVPKAPDTELRLVLTSPQPGEKLVSPIRLRALTYFPGVLRENIDVTWYLGNELIAEGHSVSWPCRKRGEHMMSVRATSGFIDASHDFALTVLKGLEDRN